MEKGFSRVNTLSRATSLSCSSSRPPPSMANQVLLARETHGLLIEGATSRVFQRALRRRILHINCFHFYFCDLPKNKRIKDLQNFYLYKY
jgi:hypothetical protein